MHRTASKVKEKEEKLKVKLKQRTLTKKLLNNICVDGTRGFCNIFVHGQFFSQRKQYFLIFDIIRFLESNVLLKGNNFYTVLFQKCIIRL